jgi:hypothetical protein
MSDLTNRPSDTDLASGHGSDDPHAPPAEDSEAPIDADDLLEEDEEHVPVDDISGVTLEDNEPEEPGVPPELEQTHASAVLLDPGTEVGEPLETVESLDALGDAEDVVVVDEAVVSIDSDEPAAPAEHLAHDAPAEPAAPIAAADFDEDRTLRPSRLPGGDWSAPAAVDPVQVQEDLRAESEAADGEPARVARLLAEIGESEERAGNEAGAARDYLAAFNARPEFREPLEALLRVLDRRRSLKNLQQLTEALVRSAESPEERVRALVARAAHQEDHEGQADEALVGLLEALETPARVEELAPARLSLELVAAKMGDEAARSRALSARAADAGHPVWRALLQIDATMLIATANETSAAELDEALGKLESQLETAGPATYLVALALEQAANHEGKAELVPVDTDERRLRTRAYATGLDVQAELIFASLSQGAYREGGHGEGGNPGDRSGVPG